MWLYTGTRATYVNGPFVTVTCTTPLSTVSLASRKSRLNTVKTQKPTTASTIAHVGVFCVCIHWSWAIHCDPRNGQPPTGVCTIVLVTMISPIWHSGCSGIAGTRAPPEVGYWPPLTGYTGPLTGCCGYAGPLTGCCGYG